MRIIYLLIFCLFTIIAFSQEPNENYHCHDFDLKIGQVSVQLNLKTQNDFIAISRRFESGYDDRKIIFKTYVEKCENLKGIFIKLSNYEILAFEDYNIICDDLPDGGHYLSSSIALTDDLYAKLSRFDIVEFNLGGANVVVKYEDKKEFKILLQCLYEAK